jgi:hypothetical protein
VKYCSLRKPQKWSDKDTYRSNSNWPRERGERVEGRELAPIAVQRSRRATNCHEAIANYRSTAPGCPDTEPDVRTPNPIENVVHAPAVQVRV